MVTGGCRAVIFFDKMSQKYCCVSGCKNYHGQLIKRGRKVTLHPFPEESSLRKAWIEIVNRKKWLPSKQSRMCSVHFPGNIGPTAAHPVPNLLHLQSSQKQQPKAWPKMQTPQAHKPASQGTSRKVVPKRSSQRKVAASQEPTQSAAIKVEVEDPEDTADYSKPSVPTSILVSEAASCFQWKLQMLRNLQTMKDKALLCNAKLVGTDGIPCLAHAAVLGAVSSTLCGMLKLNDAEHTLKTKLNLHRIRFLLNFIYTGVLEQGRYNLKTLGSLLATWALCLPEQTQKDLERGELTHSPHTAFSWADALLETLHKFKKCGVFCDTQVISSIDGGKIAVHSCVLAAASPQLVSALTRHDSEYQLTVPAKTRLLRPIVAAMYTGYLIVNEQNRREVMKVFPSLNLMISAQPECTQGRDMMYLLQPSQVEYPHWCPVRQSYVYNYKVVDKVSGSIDVQTLDLGLKKHS